MQERKIFGLIVRTVGLMLLVYSTFALFYIVAKLFGLPTRSSMTLTGEIVGFAFFFAIGLAILRVSDWIVRIAYGPDKEISN
jgi:phosphate/sulfate permease